VFVYADYVDLIGDDINALQSNTDILVEACDEIGPQVNIDKTKSETQGMKEIKKIIIKDEIIEKVNKFKYMETYVTSKSEVTEEIKNRLVSGNACFYSVQKLQTSQLISKKLKIYRTVILLVILYGCESWSTALTDEQ